MDGTPVDSNWVYGGIFPGTGDYSVIYTYDPIDKYAVYTDTIGQFTGLIDKDGVPIYEGDIIHTHYANCPRTDFIETVVFHDGRFCAEFGSEKGGKMWSLLPSTAPHLAADKTVYMEWCKVIGNIHDDPEGVRTNEDNL